MIKRTIITIYIYGSMMLCAGLTFAQDQAVTHPAWTLAVIPDTQYYVRSDENAPIFTEITQWLVQHKDEYNLQLILHVGDIVDQNKTKQWENAKESLKVFDGKLPYILAVGNHDLGKNSSDRSTLLNQYFKLSDNPLNEKIFGGYFEEGHLENAWYHFQYDNRDYVIFSLEFGPRNEVVEWANAVADEHPDQSFILVTHEFIDQESALFSDDSMACHTKPDSKNSPYSYDISKIGSVHCGQELWDAFVSRHSNFEMVLNGHYKAFKKTGPSREDVEEIRDDLAVSYRRDTYHNGRVVHQMLFNAQWAPKGGNGWIRLLQFMPDGKTVQIKTLSPYLMRTSEDKSAAWKTDADMQFTLELSPQSTNNDARGCRTQNIQGISKNR